MSTYPLAVLLSITCAFASASDAPAPVEPEAMSVGLGAKVFAENCGRCHEAPNPAIHSRREWNAIALHMRGFADLSRDETRRVLIFLRTVNTGAMHHEPAAPASR
jgi:hypothetical protein